MCATGIAVTWPLYRQSACRLPLVAAAAAAAAAVIAAAAAAAAAASWKYLLSSSRRRGRRAAGAGGLVSAGEKLIVKLMLRSGGRAVMVSFAGRGFHVGPAGRCLGIAAEARDGPMV